MTTVRDRFVAVNGLRLRVRDWGGDGPPLLALHGGAAHGHWWDPVAPLLRPRVRVLALDWRGHGRSAWAHPPAYDEVHFTADLLGLIDRLGLERVIVAGHSMGGQAALVFAGRHPDALEHLIVLDAKPRPNLERLREFQRRPPRPRLEFDSRAAALRRFRLSPP